MKIGVSGASGELGKLAIASLVSRNGQQHSIVGISRSPQTIVPPAESRAGDYDHPDSLTKAYAGLDRLLIIPSPALTPGVRARQYRAAIDGAIRAGVEHIVLLSAVGTQETAEPSVYAAYWTGEQHLIKNARRWTILRMNYYAESLAQEIQMAFGSGLLAGLGEDRVAFVSRRDVAAAAAGILLGDGHSGAIYSDTGPEFVTGAERAALAAEITGKPLHFAIVPRDAMKEGLQQAGLSDEVVNAVLDIKAGYVAGKCDIVTGDVARLSSQKPRSVRQVLTELLS